MDKIEKNFIHRNSVFGIYIRNQKYWKNNEDHKKELSSIIYLLFTISAFLTGSVLTNRFQLLVSS